MTETAESIPKDVVQEQNFRSELQEPLKNEWLSRMLDDLKEHDRVTYFHSLRVGILNGRFAKPLGLKEDEQQARGVLHDVGKQFVPRPILQKEGPLTEDEQITMDAHADASFLLVQPHDSEVANVIVAHHEYQNRSYPRKDTRPKDVLLEKAQLSVVLADLTDAWMSERPYKPALSPEETKAKLMDAFAEIRGSGKVQHPEVLEAFDESLIDFAVQTREALT